MGGARSSPADADDEMCCGLADLARLVCFLRSARADRDRTPPESTRSSVAAAPEQPEVPEEQEWEERYSELEDVKKSRAKSAVDNAEIEYPWRLRMWLYKQRFLYDNNLLERERVDRLQAIGIFCDKPLGTPSPESGTASTLSATDYGDEDSSPQIMQR
ncbi:hypothetical protein ACHAXT_009554 [Thalassiosira profunda]